jgi:hypothetical protein
MRKPQRNGDGDGRREDDVEFGLGPFRIKAHGKTVTGTIFWIVVGGMLIWHDYKSGIFQDEVTKALWVQTFIVSHPEKERADVLRKLPADVRAKITKQTLPKPEAQP